MKAGEGRPRSACFVDDVRSSQPHYPGGVSISALHQLTAAEQVQAREVLDRLWQGQPDLRLTELPGPVQDLVHDILNELAQGHAVQLRSVQAELSTQAAADLLGISRPYLIKLLEGPQAPHWKVSSHHYLRLEDVLALREQRDEERRQTMQDLADLDQILGLL